METLTGKREVPIGEFTECKRPDLALADVEKRAKKTKTHIMTLPVIVDERLLASFEDNIWKKWFTGLSEEDYGTNSKGQNIYLVSHGQGILNTSKRVAQAINKKQLLPYRFALLSPEELKSSTQGENVYMLSEIRGGKIELPQNYTIVADVATMHINKSGQVKIDDLRNDDRFLMAVGSEEKRHSLLDKIQKETKWSTFGNYHKLIDVDYSQAGGRFLIADDDNNGFNGDYFNDDARFVVVSAGGAQSARSAATPQTYLDSRIAKATEQRKPFNVEGGTYVFVPKESLNL